MLKEQERKRATAKSARQVEQRARKRLESAQQVVKNQRRRLDKLAEVEKAAAPKSKNRVIDTDTLGALAPSQQSLLEEKTEVIFEPNPGPQTHFLAASEREVLYGGAAGGGKSYAMLADPLRYCGHPEFAGIIFRRTNDELRELIAKAKSLYPKAYPGAKWSEQKSSWTFPNGGTLWFTYLDRDDDVERYQGQAFCYIGFDELTHWPTPYPWNYMRSRLRTTAPDLPLCMRATTNPGGVGSWWVRKMFIDPAPWGEAFWATDIETGEVLKFPEKDLITGNPHPKANEPLFKRRFIPAKLSDNPFLMRDHAYEAGLLSMPEAQRRQLLEGDWDVVDSAAFPEFNRRTHTYNPQEVTLGHEWTRFRACDWGYTQPACCLWFAIDYNDCIWVYRELYVKGMLAEDFARRIIEIEEAANERVRYGVLDSSTWARRGENSPSIAETMIKMGVNWRPSDRSPGSRIHGKSLIHQFLRPDPILDEPKLRISSVCTNLIRTLPMLPVDKTNSEDIDTDAEDHAYDALRYGLASRPKNPLFGALWDNRSPTRPSYRQPADSKFGY